MAQGSGHHVRAGPRLNALRPFEMLLQRQPKPEQKERLHALALKLGFREDDAIWAIFLGLEEYVDLDAQAVSAAIMHTMRAETERLTGEIRCTLLAEVEKLRTLPFPTAPAHRVWPAVVVCSTTAALVVLFGALCMWSGARAALSSQLAPDTWFWSVLSVPAGWMVAALSIPAAAATALFGVGLSDKARWVGWIVVLSAIGTMAGIGAAVSHIR